MSKIVSFVIGELFSVYCCSYARLTFVRSDKFIGIAYIISWSILFIEILFIKLEQ